MGCAFLAFQPLDIPFAPTYHRTVTCRRKIERRESMNDYLQRVNSAPFYGIVAGVLGFITIMCFVFLIKSYRAGIRIGMDKKVLKKAVMSSATFTLLPSISILLGVVALSGTLGVPLSWLRLSVIGALQYELNVAEMAAQSLGMSGLRLEEMNMQAFVTIALVMTVGILGGIFCCIFFGKKYLNKLKSAPKKSESKGPGFGAHATTAMFIGLCGAYIGSYVGKAVPREGSDWMPLAVAAIAAAVMAVFEYFIQKRGKAVLENFSLAASMLIAMGLAVAIQMAI
ncbi:MAG: hypothetical protein DBX58_02790 [Clostridiales bacterium]|nr:MAG: hypothetical protein DBX58_02790 [Clostridiales bacterium]